MLPRVMGGVAAYTSKYIGEAHTSIALVLAVGI